MMRPQITVFFIMIIIQAALKHLKRFKPSFEGIVFFLQTTI